VRWSIRNQILIPFATLQILAVAALTLMATLFSVQRVERETNRRLESVVTTLRDSSFPLTENVLRQMRGLSGAEFAVISEDSRLSASSLDKLPADIGGQLVPTAGGESISFQQGSPIEAAGKRYFATRVSGLRPSGATDLLILFPEDQWRDARRDAAVVPLAIGGITIMGMIAVSAWLASRFGRRIRTIQQQFARIAEGDFEPIAPGRRDDELRDLSRSANQLAAALQRMTASIRQQERDTLVSQVAGGLAHQFRNAMTGARMAIQLHRRRCESSDKESLEVALRQLSLTEQQLKGLLRLSSDQQATSPGDGPIAGELPQIIRDVAFLVGPLCEHESIQLDVDDQIPTLPMTDRDALCAAILNLVLNGIEAAGPQGTVSISARQEPGQVTVEVSDTGPGVAEEIADSLFDPFVTSKPEGVGLGLLLAVEAARQHGGAVACRREGSRTVFSMSLADGGTRGSGSTLPPTPEALDKPSTVAETKTPV